MKFLSNLLLLTVTLSLSIKSAYAVNPHACDEVRSEDYNQCMASSMMKADYMLKTMSPADDKKHSKVEKNIGKADLKITAPDGTESSVCEKLKKTFDIYDSYVFAQQIGIGTTETFNGSMYRKIQEQMDNHISANCSSKNAATLISDAQYICTSSCEPMSNWASPKDKKKAVVMKTSCEAICKIDGSSKKHLLQGLMTGRTTASADCSNPSKDNISNLGRNAKDVVKKSSDSNTKGPEGRQK